jgi:hypothetical protein
MVEAVDETRRAMLRRYKRNPDGWLSIATAPRDGTRIRVGRRMPPFGWITGTATFEKFDRIGGTSGGGWLSRGDGPFGELGLAHPTHWRPLDTSAAEVGEEGDPRNG